MTSIETPHFAAASGSVVWAWISSTLMYRFGFMETGTEWENGKLSARPMSNRITLSPRDHALLKLLSRTPATTALLLDASRAFEDGPFLDDRRLRERLSALAGEGLVRAWSSAHPGGGLTNYYKLTPAGFTTIYGTEAELPPRAFFAELAPSTFRHTLRLAEAIVAVVIAAHARHVEIVNLYRENELTLEVGENRLQPDCFVRLAAGGKTSSFAFEIDTSQESLDSPASNSVRHKLTLYHAYQNRLLASWLAGGKVVGTAAVSCGVSHGQCGAGLPRPRAVETPPIAPDATARLRRARRTPS